ncbi:angiopoietin-related protein 1-like isoform X2 [Topomyia yanbarensis]|uniref:angiopoietin-related protein 1-like isoform X2 n=1 Tax=Topomyia yanbarensis TaxID=2498891 RepID=UPI00273B92FA|nr:angiopoietin-related protein 1-like isoform X2 [Topomyia yanbarensis]
MKKLLLTLAAVSLVSAQTSNGFGYELLLAINEVPSCKDTSTNVSGVYRINPELATLAPFLVYCDHTVEDGGWTVIHRRFDGTLNFNRNWAEYRQGFGNLQSEYWLGLEKMHQISRSGNYELLVVLKSFNGTTKTARYDRFSVASEFEQYRLNLGRFVNGEARDSLSAINGMKFSAVNRDNDVGDGNCAITHSSGWWHKECFEANLNGMYQKGKVFKTMSWYYFNNTHDCLQEARMLIRPS